MLSNLFLDTRVHLQSQILDKLREHVAIQIRVQVSALLSVRKRQSIRRRLYICAVPYTNSALIWTSRDRELRVLIGRVFTSRAGKKGPRFRRRRSRRASARRQRRVLAGSRTPRLLVSATVQWPPRLMAQ